ncbi:hypothetical protein Dxin01_00782 [Deinococcus xinjiangensis]|uniref:Uncharacterized protein n=1 Tax=Deinococcus xinjiangensis TaxID=457454 RepID=A0ABP9V8V1_9DEIO
MSKLMWCERCKSEQPFQVDSEFGGAAQCRTCGEVVFLEEDGEEQGDFTDLEAQLEAALEADLGAT